MRLTGRAKDRGRDRKRNLYALYCHLLYLTLFITYAIHLQSVKMISSILDCLITFYIPTIVSPLHSQIYTAICVTNLSLLQFYGGGEEFGFTRIKQTDKWRRGKAVAFLVGFLLKDLPIIIQKGKERKYENITLSIYSLARLITNWTFHPFVLSPLCPSPSNPLSWCFWIKGKGQG